MDGDQKRLCTGERMVPVRLAAPPGVIACCIYPFCIVGQFLPNLKFRHTRVRPAGISVEASDDQHDDGIPQRRSALGQTSQHCKR